MNFLTYWKLEIAAILLFLAFGAGWSIKGKIDAVKAEKLEIAQQQAVIDQQKEVITKERAASVITSTVENAYESKIRDINDTYAGVLNGMLSTPSTNRVMSAVPAATGRPDAAPSGNTRRPRYRATALAIAHQCDLQTQQLISLQEWVREQAQ